jgi:hypothetical protein
LNSWLHIFQLVQCQNGILNKVKLKVVIDELEGMHQNVDGHQNFKEPSQEQGDPIRRIFASWESYYVCTYILRVVS